MACMLIMGAASGWCTCTSRALKSMASSASLVSAARVLSRACSASSWRSCSGEPPANSDTPTCGRGSSKPRVRHVGAVSTRRGGGAQGGGGGAAACCNAANGNQVATRSWAGGLTRREDSPYLSWMLARASRMRCRKSSCLACGERCRVAWAPGCWLWPVTPGTPTPMRPAETTRAQGHMVAGITRMGPLETGRARSGLC